MVDRVFLFDHKRGRGKQSQPLMSGNLDARAMRELAEKYGFAHYRKLEKSLNKAGTLKVWRSKSVMILRMEK